MELQLRSDPLFLSVHSQMNGVQHQVDCLLCAGLVGNDAVVIEISNHRQIQYALLCVNVSNICYPFAVWSIRMKLSVEQILILVDLLSHLLPFPAAADFRKLTVFLHDAKDGFGIAVNASLFQHHPHPAVAIRAKAALPLFRNGFCKGCIFLRSIQSMNEIIVSTSGYLKETTHDGYRIFISVPVDHGIFRPRSHFLSVERRKSRNSSFSIFSRLFSYLYSASVFAGLRPRVFGRTDSFSQQ